MRSAAARRKGFVAAAVSRENAGMDGSITLARAEAEELATVTALAGRIWPAAYAEMLSEGQIAYMLAWMYAPAQLARDVAEGVTYEVVRQDGAPVGFCGWSATPGGDLKLHKLYLDVALHGRGLGSFLLRHVEEEARARGCRRIVLGVNKRNFRAIRAYERNGFAVAESVVTDIGGGYVMDDHVMEKRLA